MTSRHSLETPERAAVADEADDRRPVVGIRASMDGLDALAALLGGVGSETGLAWVVAVAEHGGQLAGSLARRLTLPVNRVTEAVALHPGRVYVLDVDVPLQALDSHLRIGDPSPAAHDLAPFDRFFRALAASRRTRAAAVALAGSGSDGTLGLKAVKESGGLTVAQDPSGEVLDELLRSVLSTGVVDRVLPSARIAPEIEAYFRTHPRLETPGTAEEQAAGRTHRNLLDEILDRVRACSGRDFGGYRTAVLREWIARRMRLRQVADVGVYLEVLREDPDEVQALARDLLVSVGRFFREPDSFEALEREVIPRLFEGRGAADEVRVWSAGCATGEEAYTLAMLLTEEAERRDEPPRVRVFATDVDERSLRYAREGFYPGEIAADVGEARIRRFFEPVPGGYRVLPELRERVLFAPHDMIADQPYSGLDLVCCRNVIVNLRSEVQREVLDRFLYALRQGGFLALTRVEGRDLGAPWVTLPGLPFVYRRETSTPPAQHPPTPEQGSDPPASTVSATVGGHPSYGPLHRRMVERYAPPSLLVGPDDRIVHLSEHAGRYLLDPGGPPSSRVGRLVRRELQAELRAALVEAREHGRSFTTYPISVSLDGGVRPVVMHVRPAPLEQDVEMGYVLVLFEERAPDAGADDVSGVSEERARADARHLRALESELRAAYERLFRLTQRHDRTADELRSVNGELALSNEELRAALEELEMTNEELQSANEQMRVTANESRLRAEQLETLSTDLQKLLVATEIGALFLDRELRIGRYTPRISHLFRTRPSDRGRPLSDLTHRLRYDALLDDARAVLAGGDPTEREIQDDEGRWYLARTLPHWGADGEMEGVVLVLIDITVRKRLAVAEEESRAKSLFLSTMSHELRTPLNAVIGVVDVMESQVLGSMNEAQSSSLARIKRAAWHLVRIIEEVLSFSRSEAGKEQIAVEELELTGVVRDVVSMLEPAAEHGGIEVIFEGTDIPCRMRSDGGKVMQILTNLLGNAVKFARSEVVVVLDTEDGWIALQVRDDGHGIPAARVEEIFEPFTQLDSSSTREKGGTGLGLTIARRQARLLGGDVLVVSVEGEGSTFTLRLPRDIPRAEVRAG